MSTATVRAALATALSGIGKSVRGFQYRPTTPTPGDAWCVLGPSTRAAGTAFMDTWAIIVVLPQDERAATVWMDEYWPRLFEAVQPVAFVTGRLPILVDAGAMGSLYAMQITAEAED